MEVLAFQLACRLTDYRRALMSVLKNTNIKVLNETELFDQLLIRPLNEIDGGRETLCIVLDGLDECSVREKNATAKVLQACVGRFPRWLRVLVTARRENAVQEHLSFGRIIEVNGQGKDNLQDIHTYFMEQLKDIECDENRLIAAVDALAERSEGAFLYAYLVVEDIRSGGMLITDEQKYPRGLAEAVTMWFERLFPDEEEYRGSFRERVGAIVGSPEPLPEEEMERLLGMTETEVRDMKRRMHVFLHYDMSVFKRPTLSLEHRYIKDWIMQETAGRFCVSQKDAIKVLARGIYRQLQEGGENLTGYEALYAIDLLDKAGETKKRKNAQQNRQLLASMVKYGDWCIMWGAYSEAMMLHQMKLECTNLLAIKNITNLNYRREIAAGYERIAEIKEKQGDYDEALKQYCKGREIWQRLFNSFGKINDLRGLSVNCERTVSVYENQCKYEEAHVLNNKCLEINEQLVRKEGKADDWRSLSININRHANYLSMKGDFKEALELYKKSLEIRERLAINHEDVGSQRDLCVSYDRIAEMYEKQANEDQALILYQKIIAFAERQVSERGTPDDQQDLSISYDKVAEIFMKKGQIEKAMELFKKSMEIRENVMEIRGTLDDQSRLSGSYVNIADALQKKNRQKEALELYNKSIHLQKELVKKRGTIDDRRDLSNSYDKLAEIYMQKGKVNEALELYERIVESRKHLFEESGLIVDKWDLALSSYLFGKCLQKKGRKVDIEIQFQRAIDLCHELLEEQSEYQNGSIRIICAIEEYYKNENNAINQMLKRIKTFLSSKNDGPLS